MRLSIPIIALLFGAVAFPSLACSIPPPTPFKDRLRSKPVEVGSDCSFVNAGLNDHKTGGPAEDVGNGRVVQMLIGDHHALVVDCDRREAIILKGPVIGEEQTSCGPFYDYGTLRKPEGVMSLGSGEDLTDLISVAHSENVLVDTNVRYLLTDKYGAKFWKKDRVDLLCGCKLFYPDSAGAAK